MLLRLNFDVKTKFYTTNVISLERRGVGAFTDDGQENSPLRFHKLMDEGFDSWFRDQQTDRQSPNLNLLSA